MSDGNFIRVTRNRPCPICGHSDWCVIIPKPDTELIYCMRQHDRVNTIGADGSEYVYVKDTGDGELFCLKEDYDRSHEQYKREHQQFKKAHTTFEKKSELIKPLDNDKLDGIYRELLSELVLDDRHRRYLHSQGWSDELIAMRGVKSFPESDELRDQYRNRTKSLNKSRKELAKSLTQKFGSLIGVPGYYEFGGHGTFFGPSGIVYPMYDENGYIKRLRVRMDFLDQKRAIIIRDDDAVYRVGEKNYRISMKGVCEVLPDRREVYLSENGFLKGKYRTLSSFVEDTSNPSVIRNKLVNGCRSGNEVSLYTSKGDDMSMFFIVEGEPKSIFSNYKLKAPVISVPGVNSYRILFKDGWIGKMKAMGMCLVVVAYDADKVSNPNVLHYEKQLVDELINAGVSVAIADWDMALGKGLDDLLANGHMPEYHVVCNKT